MLEDRDIKNFKKNFILIQNSEDQNERCVELLWYEIIKRYYINKYFNNNAGEVYYSRPYNGDGLITVNTLNNTYSILIEAKYDFNCNNNHNIYKVLSQAIYYIKQYEINNKLIPAIILLISKSSLIMVQTKDVITFLNNNYNWIAAANENDENLVNDLIKSSVKYEKFIINDTINLNKILTNIEQNCNNSIYKKSKQNDYILPKKDFLKSFILKEKIIFSNNKWYKYNDYYYIEINDIELEKIFKEYLINNNIPFKHLLFKENLNELKLECYKSNTENDKYITTNNKIINLSSNEIIPLSYKIFTTEMIEIDYDNKYNTNIIKNLFNNPNKDELDYLQYLFSNSLLNNPLNKDFIFIEQDDISNVEKIFAKTFNFDIINIDLIENYNKISKNKLIKNPYILKIHNNSSISSQILLSYRNFLIENYNYFGPIFILGDYNRIYNLNKQLLKTSIIVNFNNIDYNINTAKAFLSWRIEGALQWYNNPKAEQNIPETIENKVNEWNENNDLILGWFNENIKKDSQNHFITIDDLCNNFNDWLTQKGNSPVSQRFFIENFINHKIFRKNGLIYKKLSRITKELQRSTYYSNNYKTSELKQRVNYVIGISFK